MNGANSDSMQSGVASTTRLLPILAFALLLLSCALKAGPTPASQDQNVLIFYSKQTGTLALQQVSSDSMFPWERAPHKLIIQLKAAAPPIALIRLIQKKPVIANAIVIDSQQHSKFVMRGLTPVGYTLLKYPNGVTVPQVTFAIRHFQFVRTTNH